MISALVNFYFVNPAKNSNYFTFSIFGENFIIKMNYSKLANEPQIVYACLAENQAIQHEYAARKGNLHSVAAEVIRKVTESKS